MCARCRASRYERHYGQQRLRIIETGKFSITLNRGSTEERADGIRVYVDATKIPAVSNARSLVYERSTLQAR